MAEANLRAICPIFQVSNLERGIEFYTRVMGFELAWTWGDPPDRASLCRDAVEITLEVEANPILSHAYIQVEGIDAYFARVTSAGAKVARSTCRSRLTACATDGRRPRWQSRRAWARRSSIE